MTIVNPVASFKQNLQGNLVPEWLSPEFWTTSAGFTACTFLSVQHTRSVTLTAVSRYRLRTTVRTFERVRKNDEFEPENTETAKKTFVKIKLPRNWHFRVLSGKLTRLITTWHLTLWYRKFPQAHTHEKVPLKVNRRIENYPETVRHETYVS